MSQSKLVREGKLLATLSGPIIIGQVGQNLITLADTMMVGSLGAVALGASAFAGSVFVIFYIFGVGLLSPVTALFARAMGQGDPSRTGVLLKNSLLVAFTSSLILIGLLLCLMPLLKYLGQTPEVLAMGHLFFQIIVWSILPGMIYQAYKQFGDGIGKTKVSMYVMIGGVVFNIAANYILIHGLYGFPKLGLNGSAWATLLARTLMALAMIIYVHSHVSFRDYLTEKWNFYFQWPLLKYIIRLGLPNGFTYLFEVGAFASAAVMMGWFGSSSIAAHQITISLASMSFLVTLGIGISASIRVGYEMGRGEFEKSRFAGFTAIGIGATYMSLCGVGFYLLRWWLPTLYIADIDVIELAASLFTIVAVFQIFDGIQAVAIGALRGMSDTQVPSLIVFFAYWMMGLPSGYFLAFHAGFGPIGIWLGLLLGLVFVSLLLIWRYHVLSQRYLKKLAP